MTGSHSGKVTPLIICDLNNGAVSVEHMMGVRAEHIFLALHLLQYRFGTEIVIGFTDIEFNLGRPWGRRATSGA